MALECYLTSITNHEGSVHQVEKKTAAKTSPRVQHVKPCADFMLPGTELSLDPKDSSKSGTQIEPTDEIEQVELENEKSLNIGKAVQ